MQNKMQNKVQNIMQTATIYPGKAAGSVQIPPSKSLAHRAVICAALANGESRLTGLDPQHLSNDIQTTIAGMQRLGANIRFAANNDLIVQGGELTLSHDEPWVIDCGESGSTLRFFIPIFSLLGLPVLLIGRSRLPQRPQTVYSQIFAEQNLTLKQTPAQDGWLVRGPLRPGEFTLQGNISSQFISGLLFALPLLAASSTLHILPPFESRSYVELTIDMLSRFGIAVRWLDAHTLQIPGNQHYCPANISIEGDFSQLAFFAVLGNISSAPQGIRISGANPLSQQGDRKIIEIIRQMNGQITQEGNDYICRPARLRATPIDLADCPDLGPVLTVLAAFAEGKTRIYNAGRLRIKESDRIADVVQELSRCGVKISATADEMLISGSPQAQYQAAGPCLSHNDHRIVMALSVLAAAMGSPLQIQDAQAVNKSYPQFFQDLQGLGLQVIIKKSSE